MKQQDILVGKQVSTGYRQGKRTTVVHEGLDFCLRSGELTCLLGGNGVGKSTLLRTLAGAQPLLAGTLDISRRPLADLSDRERSKVIGLVLTDRMQAGGLSVYELVGLGRQPHTGFFGRLNRRDKEVIAHALDAVGMTAKANSYVAELSDGERQKAMIAKALVQECPLVILDEPTAFLDVVSRIEVMELLHRLAVEEHKAILLSTHDIEQALVLADRLWLMTREGMQCGVTEDLILSGAMDRLFCRGNIRFDLMHGVYSPTVCGGRTVYLKAEDEVLRHWAQNALNRNGFLCMPDCADGQHPRIVLSSAREMTLEKDGDRVCFHSFAGLLGRLKD